jgi:hypothetical protein
MMGGYGKGAKEERDGAASSGVEAARGAAFTEVPVSRQRPAVLAGKRTAPSRRSEELAHFERQLADANQADGEATSVMDVMTLVEAERRLAEEGGETGRSGVRAIQVDAPVVAAPASAVNAVIPLTARVPSIAPVRPSLLPSRARTYRARRRRLVALLLVSAVMVVATALLAVGWSRKGWVVPAGVPTKVLGWAKQRIAAH